MPDDLYSPEAELDLIKQSLSICFDNVQAMIYREREELWMTFIDEYYAEHYERVRKIQTLFAEKRKGSPNG